MMLLLLTAGPMAGAALSYLIGRKSRTARDFFADVLVIAEFLLFLVLGMNVLAGDVLTYRLPGFCMRGLSFKMDGFRFLYGTIAAFMWMMTTIFSEEYFAHYRNRNRYYLFMLVTLGATVGVFLSADLFTTFLFFEIMSFTSYVWVAHDEKKESLRAAQTYLAVAVIGGMVMLMGLFLLNDAVGTLDMDSLFEACRACPDKGILYAAGGCMLFGFGAKAGMFPLHIWLPKAHPVAPAPASALLSGILTKSGVFGVIVVSCNIFLHDAVWGFTVLLFGVVTMFIGAFLAVFSVNLKYTLACSSMSQIGFILVGIGMQGLLGEENALAVRGTVLHMVNHSLIKLVLFMAAGVVFFNLHKLDLNEVRGFGRKKPLLKLSFLAGALSISGVPLFSGYVSKTLLHESIVEFTAHGGVQATAFMKGVEYVFLFTGGLTAAYMMKLFVAVFVEENEDQKSMDASNGRYMNRRTAFALVGSAVVLAVLGVVPSLTMDFVADISQGFMHGTSPHESVRYFSITNLSGAAVSILTGIAVYFGFIRTCLMRKENGKKYYVNRLPKWFDLENLLYRPLLMRVLPFALAFVCRIFDKITDGIIWLIQKTVLREARAKEPLPYGNKLTHCISIVLNCMAKVMNHTIRRKRPIRVSFEKRTAQKYEEFITTTRLFEKSVSYGLLMFCIGLFVTLIYLLLSI